ncbi:hypothetical protein ScPMuIL_015709 [Solemya velum]
MTLTVSRKRRYSALQQPGPSREPVGQDDTGKNNITVVVRIRPENAREREGNSAVIVKPMNEHVLVFDPNEQSSPGYGGLRKKPRDIRKHRNKDLKFAFDNVFGPESNNIHVYETTTKRILNGLLNGYNCSVFAYGSTGAGKTHTMLGNATQPGVMYLTMLELYDRISAIGTEKSCEVAVSYLEVYNEQIHDLLMPGKNLPVREDANSGVVIQGLSLHKPRNADELFSMLQFGNKNRTQHPTDANAESSRSHAVFQVFVRQKDRTANISAEVRVAKMCLVDLAGSERATVTKNCGARFREGANINRSLLALGNVINALADHKYKGHIPYRDSKLTRLLKDSLGGNCQTVMIAAVSPSRFSYEDTYNTLRYADRAKYIRTELKKNILNVDFHVARYGQIVDELRKEIGELKIRLQVYEEKKTAAVAQAPLIICDEKLLSLQTQLQTVYKSRISIHQSYLKINSNCRNLKWKILKKERYAPRLETVTDIQRDEKLAKLKTGLQLTKEKLCSVQQQEEGHVEQMSVNSQQLLQVQTQILSQFNTHQPDSIQSQLLESNLELYQCRMELSNTQHQVEYLKKLTRIQDKDVQTGERLILDLLKLVKQQHFILKGHGLATSDIESEFASVQTQAEGQGVSWADQSSQAVGSHTTYTLTDVLNFPSVPSLSSGPSVSSVDEPVNAPTQTQIIAQPVGTVSHSDHLLSCQQTASDEYSAPSLDNIVDSIKEKTNLFAGHTPSLKKLLSFAHPPKNEINFDQDVNGVTCPVQSPNFTFPIPSTDSFVPAKKVSPMRRESEVAKNQQNSCLEIAEGSGDDTFIVTTACDLAIPSIDTSETVVKNIGTHLPKPGVKDLQNKEIGNGVSKTSVCSHSDAVQSDLLYGLQQMNLDTKRSESQTKSVPEAHTRIPNRTMLESGTITKIRSNPQILRNGHEHPPVHSVKIVNSQTVTKSQTSVMEKSENDRTVKRAIDFMPGTPNTPSLSYADAVKTPTPARVPLKEVNGDNTPLALPLNTTDRNGVCSSFLKAESKGRNGLTPMCLFSNNNENAKENVKALQDLGLPSLVQQSYKRQNGNLIIGKSVTPGYLQQTKSVAYRNRKNNNRNILKSSDNYDNANENERGRSRIGHGGFNFKSKMGNRSQSTSSLSRPGWQI